MAVWFMSFFLTLVLTLIAMAPAAVANPTKSRPAVNKVMKPPPDDSPSAPRPVNEMDEYNLLPTPPMELPGKEASKTYVYPYRQALAPRLGMMGSTDEETQFTYLVGISYLWPRYASPQAELGADVVSKFGGHLNFGVKYILHERNYFRPYWLWGLTHEVVPDDRLATFLDTDNYYGRLGVGFEDVIELPKSVRLELELLAGLDRQMLLLCFGYSWGW
jgi:hypothetical protein